MVAKSVGANVRRPAIKNRRYKSPEAKNIRRPATDSFPAFQGNPNMAPMALVLSLLGHSIKKGQALKTATEFFHEHHGSTHTMPKTETTQSQFLREMAKPQQKQQFKRHIRVEMPDATSEGNFQNATHTGPRHKPIKLKFSHTVGKPNRYSKAIEKYHPTRTTGLPICSDEFKDGWLQQFCTSGAGEIRSLYWPSAVLDTVLKSSKGLENNCQTVLGPTNEKNPTVPWGFDENQAGIGTAVSPTPLVGRSDYCWGETWTLGSRIDYNILMDDMFHGNFTHGDVSTPTPEALVGRQDMLFKISQLSQKLYIQNTSRLMPVNISLFLTTPRHIKYSAGRAIGSGQNPPIMYTNNPPIPEADIFEFWDFCGTEPQEGPNWNHTPLKPSGFNTVDGRYGMPITVDNIPNTNVATSAWGLDGGPFCTEFSFLKQVTPGLSQRFQKNWRILHKYNIRLQPEQTMELDMKINLKGLLSFKEIKYGLTDNENWDSIFTSDGPVDWSQLDQPAAWPNMSIHPLVFFHGDPTLLRQVAGTEGAPIKAKDSTTRGSSPVSIRMWNQKQAKLHGTNDLDLSRSYDPQDEYAQIKTAPGFIVSSRQYVAGDKAAHYVPYAQINENYSAQARPHLFKYQEGDITQGTAITNSSTKYEHTAESAAIPRKTGSIAIFPAVPDDSQISGVISKLDQLISVLKTDKKEKDGKKQKHTESIG